MQRSSINQSMNQSINESINQSRNHSINQQTITLHSLPRVPMSSPSLPHDSPFALRLLTTNKLIGRLIGESGKEIARLRQVSGTQLHISELV